MLKKFYIEDYLYNKIKQEEFVLSEAVQGDITKHTLLQLFSMDNIKYLNQFMPEDHKVAEIKRMHILYDAMQHRDTFLKKGFEENFIEQKEKLKELFETKKEIKIYFTKDFEETIINHCARKQAWEKTLKEKQKEWWDSSAADGGRQYQVNDFVVDIKERNAVRRYKVNLHLKEMAQRIEGNSGDDMGSDLSFPREDPLSWSYKKKEFLNKKRFNGMLIPSDKTIVKNYNNWLAASASGLLSPKLLKHGDEIDIEGEEKEEIPGLESKNKISFNKHDSLKNKNMLDVESVLIRKEIRAIFENNGLSILIIKSYGKPEKADEYENFLNIFIEKLLNLGNEIGSSGSKRLLTFLNTITHDPKNPEQFFKDILTFPSDEEKLLTSLKEFSEEDNELINLSFYKKLKNAVDKNGLIEMFDKEPYKKSFINLIIQRQLIKWIKEGNFKVKNPITGTDELAEIQDDKIIIPDLHVPSFKKTIVYYNPNAFVYDPKTKGKVKKEEQHRKSVNMPVLLPGSVLIEKGRDEEDDTSSSSGDIPKTKIGEEIWNPHKGKYEQRYYDKKKQYEERKAASLLNPDDLIGIQGTEDKIIGGLSPNRTIESFKFLCPDPEGKDNTFWKNINSLILFNGKLALCHFKPATSTDEVPTVEFKELSPSVSGYKSIVETPTEFIVIKRIAEQIANKLHMTETIDSHIVKPERLSAMQHFPELYHVIFAKIFSNLGDKSMLEPELLDKFIYEKVANYMDKDIANRGGRSGRIGTVANIAGKDEEEGEEGEGEDTELPVGLDKLVSKDVALRDMQSYIEALSRNFLTLCKSGKSACGICTNPLDTRCTVVMDEYLIREKLEKSIELADKADSIRHIGDSKPAPAAPAAPAPKSKSERIKAHKAAYKEAIYAEENASTKQEKEEANKKAMEIIKSVAKENGMSDSEAQDFLDEEHWEWRKQLQKTGMLKDAAAVLKSNPLILKNYRYAIKDGNPEYAQQVAVQLARQAGSTYEAAEEILKKAHANTPDDDDYTYTAPEPAPASAPAVLSAPVPAAAPAVLSTPVPAADRKLTQAGLFGDLPLPNKPTRKRKILDPSHDVQDFVVQAKMKIIELMEPIVNIKFANIQLHSQQDKENKRAEASNIFKDKMEKELANTSLSNDKKNNILKEMEKERDNQYSLLSEEYKTITEQLEVARKKIILILTNYFRHVDENQSLKLSLLDALETYGINIEEHIPADILRKHGL